MVESVGNLTCWIIRLTKFRCFEEGENMGEDIVSDNIPMNLQALGMYGYMMVN